jgi:hypothetical protein
MQEEVSEFAAFVGIDWADRKHDICLQVSGADAVELSVIEHRLKAIEDWAEAARALRRLPHRRLPSVDTQNRPLMDT